MTIGRRTPGRHSPRDRARLMLVVGVLLLMAPATIRSAEVATFAVIVHPGTPIEEMSVDRLRRIYRGDQQYWRDGTKIVVLIHRAGTDERRAVLDGIFRMTEAEYKEFWITRIFRGDVTSGPKSVSDTRSLIELVRTVPGSIGIVGSADVPDDVPVLSISGELPSSADSILD